MKKSYETTINETVNTAYRRAELQGYITKQKWIGFIWVPFIFVAVYYILPVAQIKKVLFAAGAAAGFIPVHLLTYKYLIRKRFRKLTVKAQGTDRPVPCEYELDETGVTFRKLGQELTFFWANVKKLNETDNSLEIITEPIGIAVIPRRIFDSPEELGEWIRFIKGHGWFNRRK